MKLGVCTQWENSKHGMAYSLGYRITLRLQVIFEDGQLGELDDTYGLYVKEGKVELLKPLEELSKKEWKALEEEMK